MKLKHMPIDELLTAYTVLEIEIHSRDGCGGFPDEVMNAMVERQDEIADAIRTAKCHSPEDVVRKLDFARAVIVASAQSSINLAPTKLIAAIAKDWKKLCQFQADEVQAICWLNHTPPA